MPCLASFFDAMSGVKKLMYFSCCNHLPVKSLKPPIGPSPPLSLGQTLKNGSAYVSDDSESKKKFFFLVHFRKNLENFSKFFEKKFFSKNFFGDFFMGLGGVLKHFFFYGP